MIDSRTIVGLKYKGTRIIPFTFMNENLVTKKMSWEKSGNVVDVPLSDAKWMVKYSPSDFDIVFKNVADAINLEESKHDSPGFVDSEEDNRGKRGPGRPKRDA